MPWTPPKYATPEESGWAPPKYAQLYEEEVAPEPSTLGKAWDFLNTGPSLLGPLAESFFEPLMQYGESGTSLPQTAARYGGAYGTALGQITDSMLSPLNLGLTALSGGANLAGKVGSQGLAQALETPGRLAALGQIGHGGYNMLDSNKTTPERIGGAFEGLMGMLGVRSNVGPKSTEMPANLQALVNEMSAPPLIKVPKGKAPLKSKIILTDTEIPSKSILNKDPNFNQGMGNPEMAGAAGYPKPGVVESFIANEEGGFSFDPIKKLFGKMFSGAEKAPKWEPPSYASVPEKPIVKPNKTWTAPSPETEEVTQDAVTRLQEAMTLGLKNRVAQDELYSFERAKRAQAISEVNTPGLKGYYEQLGMLRGELPKIPTEAKLDESDVNALLNAVTNSPLKPYEQINAKTGLVKLVSGITPQKSEIKLLTNVFGDDFGKVVLMHAGIPVHPENMVNTFVNLPKSMMATMDVSAPLRQGLPLAYRKEYWKAFSDMFGYFGSEKSFDGLMQNLEARPLFKVGEESGLFLSGLGDDLARREEAFMSPIAEKIPGFGRVVKASERAYIGFLNQLRSDTFDNLLKDAVRMGHDPKKIAPTIAKFVNTSTGRGSLGMLEKNAVELNNVFFSPRLISSRLTMLNPVYYMDAPPIVRQEALKALVSVAAAGLTTAALAKSAGADVSVNPTSSDFGKAKFGKTRLDPFAGFQQYVVAASRLISGKSTSSTGRNYNLGETFVGPTRASIVGDFIKSKESPLVSFIHTMLEGDQGFPTTGTGRALTQSKVRGEIINRYTPMIMSDLIDIYKTDPDLLPLGILGALGMSIQTYPMNEKGPGLLDSREDSPTFSPR